MAHLRYSKHILIKYLINLNEYLFVQFDIYRLTTLSKWVQMIKILMWKVTEGLQVHVALLRLHFEMQQRELPVQIRSDYISQSSQFSKSLKGNFVVSNYKKQ